MNKKIIYLISVITFLLILTISYFIPLSLSGLVNNSNQVSMVWNDIGVRNGMTYMDCTEYQSLTTEQNKAILALLDEYTYRRTAILNHYEPQIVKASVRTVNQPDGSKQRIVDQEIKAYILSELAMKVMVKYDLNKKPSKRRPPQSGSLSDFDLTG